MDRACENFSGIAELPFGDDDNALKADIGSLEGLSLINVNRGIASIRSESAFVTDQGRAYLRDVESRRSDRGLVQGPQLANGSIQRARITPEGEAIVEQFDSSIRAASSQGSGGSSSTEFTTHFHGDVHGAVAIQGNATQANNGGFLLEALVAALDAVRDAAADLDDEDRGRVLTYVDLIRSESGMDAPDPDLMSKGLGRLKALGTKTGNAALASSIGLVVKALASAFGIG